MYYQAINPDLEKRLAATTCGCYEQPMGVGGGDGADDNGGEEPVTPRDVAAYIHDIAGALALAAREAGLAELAETLARAQSQSGLVLARAKGRKAAVN
jgi:hypothetical protein